MFKDKLYASILAFSLAASIGYSLKTSDKVENKEQKTEFVNNSNIQSFGDKYSFNATSSKNLRLRSAFLIYLSVGFIELIILLS